MVTKADVLKDRRIERAFYKSCSGVQINVFDMPKVFRAGRLLVDEGLTDEQLAEGVRAFVDTIRRN